MEINSLRSVALQKFKTENNMNPYYMKETFSKTTNLAYRPLDINFNQNNTTKYRNNSLRIQGPPHLCSEIKKEIEHEKLKNYMNDWFDMKCKCNMCYFLKNV